MTTDKPHPLGLSEEDQAAVTQVLADHQERSRTPRPESGEPEDVKAVVDKLVQDYASEPKETEASEKSPRKLWPWKR